MKNERENDKDKDKGLQKDLLKMLEDSDDLEDTEFTNNPNQSETKDNDSLQGRNFSGKEINFESLGKDFEIKNKVNFYLKFYILFNY